MSSAGPAISPQIIIETITAYQRSAALRAAIELDVFSAIGKAGASAAQVAQKTAASERGIRILCDTLTAHGLLNKSSAGYLLTPESSFFLDKSSPAYMGSISGFLCSDELLNAFRKLTDAVRKGGTAMEQNGTSPEHPMWVEFARSMAPMMMMPAKMIAGILGSDAGAPWRVLDVAAGHGMFGLTIALSNPNAKITALDWPAVLQVAEENAKRFGVSDRFEKLSGSAFSEDFGKDLDVVLFTNFLHHFDVATCEQLIRKAYTALKPGGRLAVLEFVPNDDRVSPPMAATFSLVMLADTPAGDAYTFKQLHQMCTNSGFSMVERHDLPPTPETLVLATK